MQARVHVRLRPGEIEERADQENEQQIVEGIAVRLPLELTDPFEGQDRRDQKQGVGQENRGPIRGEAAQADEQPAKSGGHLVKSPTAKPRIGFLRAPGNQHDNTERHQYDDLDDYLRAVIENEIYR